jgi:uncharacterized alkaline shock family protein YloU
VNDPTGPRPAAPRHLLNAGSLACGADVDTLLEQVADGHARQLTDHQRDCVHCRAAIGELNALWSPVRELAAAPVPPPPGLATAVIGRIRRLARDVGYTLEMTDGGAIRIAARIVAALARDSASRVPGVRLALGRTTHGPLSVLAQAAMPADRRAGTAGVLGRTAVVDLTIAVNYDRPVHHVARDIQKQVAAALRNDLGLRAATVNVVIGDILDATGE